jgi:hypothetical protein
MLCLAKRDIAPWGAVICLGIEAFFFAKNFKKIFVIHEPFVKKGVFLCSLHKNQMVEVP